MESRSVIAIAAIVVGLSLHCGGRAVIDGGGGQAASTSAGSITGAGGTTSADPCERDGFRACNIGDCGANACGKEGCSGDQEFLDDGFASLCINDASKQTVFAVPGYFCHQAQHEDDLCAHLLYSPSGFVLALPAAAGQLLYNLGAGDQVHYTDHSRYTGEPLPSPTTCPASPGLKLCGASCGSCGNDEVCRGRSPRHPYGVCLPAEPRNCSANAACFAGEACFIFEVDEASQALADYYGTCVDAAACQASLPFAGGAKCLPSGG
ncbi:MAG: hypothetical protein KC731_20500 [Myxococcales bacterium]|nr:hypothetical protein [Myxococcales bacterium]